jgi:chromatin remodeling complex protein RSC6
MPSYITKSLAEFLNIPYGEKVPRNDVTRMINEYITSNGLRDEKDKRVIRPNEALQKIFNSLDTDNITYFNLQTYIKHHFIKELV